MPVAAGLASFAFASLIYVAFVLQNLTDKMVLLFLFPMNTGMFEFLAEMLDKRSKR